MPTPGKNFPGEKGFPTPNGTPPDPTCRIFRVPNSDDWLGLLMGAITPLTVEENYYPWGSVTPADAAEAWTQIEAQAYADAVDPLCPTETVSTPFWDTASDVDDEEDRTTQTWYGEVTDRNGPPGSLTFFENVAIWTFTGLLAVSGTPAAAILFSTVAPKFVIAQRAGSVGEVIRIVVDAQDQALIDTTGLSGTIIETPIDVSANSSPHDIMIIKVS